MKKRKNLFYFDDICILLSYLLTILFFVRMWPWINLLVEGQDAGEVLLMASGDPGNLTLLLIASWAVALQIIGRIFRIKERHMLKMIDTIVLYKSLTLHTLALDSSLSEEKLKKYLEGIERRGFLPISFDGNTITLQVDKGNGNSAYVERPAERPTGIPSERATASAPQVSATMPVPGQIGPTVSDTFTPETSGTNPVSAPRKKEKKFNIAVFIILFFVFWPLAVIYIMRFVLDASARKTMMEKIEEIRKAQERGELKDYR